MPKHIVRLLLLLVVFGAAALAAKIYFVPNSYWKYGHYRANAVTEIAADVPMYRGPHDCASCHRRRFGAWSASRHQISCEDCHGAAGRHPLLGKPPPPAGRTTHQRLMYARYDRVTGRMHVPTNTVRLCSQCHAKLPGRPALQPQVVVSLHAGEQQCTTCHDPHAPQIVFPAVPPAALMGTAAAGSGKAAVCAGCHGANGVSVQPEWPDLAGQKRAYLVLALQAYQHGTRKAPIMNQMAGGLNGADIGNLAAYFSALPASDPSGTPAVPAAGAAIARKEACATCHGERGISPNPAGPNLAAQRASYLAAALDAYRSGARQSALMVPIAQRLAAADVEQLARFYAALRAPRGTTILPHDSKR